jgi:transcriptional regulator GlxA family with amidase domain
VTEYIEVNLDGHISVSDLAGLCDISSGHLARAFRASTGVAPHQWLMNRRIKRARELLLGWELSMSEIALLCGFSGQSHFKRVFSRRVRQTRSTWQRRNNH